MQIMRGIALLVLAGHAALSIPVWAADVAAPGVPNFHQVNERIYRGGQPTGEGWNSLAKLGVKTVVNLRYESDQFAGSEARAVEAAGMHYVNVRLKGTGAPPDAKVTQALALLEADSGGPVFVHCRRGADRTGTVIACYRITHDHWSNRQALEEAVRFGLSWVEFGMQRYILNFHASGMQTIEAQPPR